MATSLKTICFPFPPLASITDATVTNFTQITVDLPESSKTFKKVWVETTAMDIVTVTGGTVGEVRIGLRLGAAAYTTVTQLNDIVHGSENLAPHYAADFTSHFTTNWTGTSMTCDVQVYWDQTTGTTLGMVNGTALLWVTYEYDDTSSTQVGNAWIPFTSTTGAIGTTKPGTANDTIPNLDSFLGYGTLSYKHIMVIMEGNECINGNTTDFTVSVQVDTLTTRTGGNHEAALASDRFVREFFNMMSGGSPLFTTSATHSIYWWGTGASRMNHAAVTMLVVFTFDATSANDGNVSLRLPFCMVSPAGGTTSSDYQTSIPVELWIEEPATITTQKSACQIHWQQAAAITASFRCGSQSFTSYTDAAAANCGGSVLQRTCDDNITLARGKNTLTCAIYRTSTTVLGWGLSGWWIINYKCGKPSGGWGRANRSVVWPLNLYGTGAAPTQVAIAATAPAIPETDYFLSVVGAWDQIMGTTTTQGYWHHVEVERLAAEGGVKWENLLNDEYHTDAVPGLWQMFSCHGLNYFKRYPTDPISSHFDIETSRRYRVDVCGRNNTMYCQTLLTFTYHSISWSVTRAVTGSGGGTVQIRIFRVSDDVELYSTSRVGDGNYTFTSYDTADTVYAVGYEDGTHRHRSNNFTAS